MSETGMAVKARARPRRVRAKYTNRFKVLICHVLAWGLALTLPIAALLAIYPVKLYGSAPLIAENISNALPFTKGALMPAIESATPRDESPEAILAAMERRDAQWRVFLIACFAVSLVISLTLENVWRWMFVSPTRLSRAAPRAVMLYRVFLLLIALVNALFALMCYMLGLRFVAGRGVWDYAACFGGYVLNILAALICFRLAAPPAVSGRHAFFRRL